MCDNACGLEGQRACQVGWTAQRRVVAFGVGEQKGLGLAHPRYSASSVFRRRLRSLLAPGNLGARTAGDDFIMRPVDRGTFTSPFNNVARSPIVWPEDMDL